MIRYTTMERFDLQICKKKSYTNGSRELVKNNCKHILSTSAMYIVAEVKPSIIIDVRPHRQSFLMNRYHGNAQKGTKYI